MEKKIPLIFCLILFCGFMQLSGQSLSATPLIKNFGKQTYHGGTQTWDIAEAPSGLVFFANNNGLLLYDGKEFSNYPLPKNTILRSVFYDVESNRVYAGGQNELGYYALSAQGIPEYHGLEDLLPQKQKGFEDVWGIEKVNGVVYFQTSNQVFSYDGKSIQTLKPSENFLENLYLIRNKLFLTDSKGTIFLLQNGSFKFFAGGMGLDISSLVPFTNNSILITTYKNGIYLLKDQQISHAGFDDALLKESRIYRAIAHGNEIILATNRSGIFFMDSLGILRNQINVQDGLQNNNVLSLFLSSDKNLWVGLDNGIDHVRINYPFGYIYPDALLKGTGYAMVEFKGRYYFGTNNGLYTCQTNKLASKSFELIQNTEGQVWWIQELEGKLFVSHHDGLFEVNENVATKIADIRGCWKLLALKAHPGFYAMGTYNGISILKWENNSLVPYSKLNTFKESSRFLEEDVLGNIWVGHPYKGLYRIEANKTLSQIVTVKRYGLKQGLPSETENYVFNTPQGLCFGTLKGVYTFDEEKERFLLNTRFDTSLAYKRIFEGKEGKIWYIAKGEISCLKPDYNGVDYTLSKLTLPKLDQNLVGGFEFLNECENEHLFLGVETGFVHINLSQINRFFLQPPRVLITGIRSQNDPDSLYFKYLLNIGEKYIIPNRSIEFGFSSPNGNFYNELLFSSYLEGWDKDWSSWKTSTGREFSRLSYGDYVLHVKARCMGLEGEETILKFTIPAPWYWSSLAKIVYMLIAIILILMIGFYPQMLVRKKAIRIIAEKDNMLKRQTEILMMEREKQERELVELRNQQLQKELEHQGRELASSTMHIVQKSEMLLSIKDKLKRITQISNDPKIKPEIQELIRNIEKDTLIDKDWEKFERYFNHIHDSYTQSLKEKFPMLTANDIKMCAYLRMNLSTKEIASILNITTRGVEISRYRLRKKMGLENGINLTDYLSKL